MRSLGTFLLVSCFGGPILADGVSTNLLTPELVNHLADEAWTNNSALWAARARVSAAEHNARSVPIWRDPELMFGGMSAEQAMRQEDGDLMYGVEQMLPVFGKEKAARSVARKEAEVEEAELEYRFQNLRRELAGALFKAALADEVLAVGRQDLAWLTTLTTAVEQRYQAGNATQVEVLRTQNELSKRRQQITRDENNRESAYATVNRLLNRNIISAWARLELPPVAPALPMSDRLLDLSLKFDPRLNRMRKGKEQAESVVQRSKKEARPDLSAGVQVRQYSGTGEERSTIGFLKMTIPWINRGKYKSAIQRDEAKVKEIESEIEDYTYDLLAEIHHILARIDNARTEALLYESEILPRTQLSLSSAEAAWRAGSERFGDVIEARRILIEARIMRARAIAEQYISLYELTLCCGLGNIEPLQNVLLGKEQP